MQRHTGPRPLVEGALLAAVAVILALVAFYVPPLGVGIAFLWPVPVALVHLRHGFRVSILTIVVAGLVLTTFVGPLEAIGMVSTFGLAGLALGWCFQKGVPPLYTVLIGGLAVLGSVLVSLALSFIFLKVAPAQMLTQFSEAITEAEAILGRFGLPESQMREAKRLWEGSIRLMQYVFPVMFVGSALVNSALNFQVSRAVLNRMGYSIEDLPPFETWRVPTLGLLGLAVGFLINTLSGPWRVGAGMGQLRRIEIITDPLLDIGPWRWVYVAGMNVQLLFLMLYLVHGMAVAYWFMVHRWRLSKPMRIFLLIMAMFNPFMNQVLTFVGVLDSAFDWRKLGFRR